MKKSFFSWITPLILLLTLLNSCVTSSISTESKIIVAPDAKLTDIKTFAWVQLTPVSAAAYNNGFSNELDRDLRHAIEEYLKQKGIMKVEQNADILIAYDVSVAVPPGIEKANNYENGFGYGYAYMAGYRYAYTQSNLLGYRPVDLYKQGTLVIDFVSPDNNQLIWRGWAEGALPDQDPRFAKVQQHVAGLLQKMFL
jgi:hypothetical protein